MTDAIDQLRGRNIGAIQAIAEAISPELRRKWPTRDYGTDTITKSISLFLDDHQGKTASELRSLAETLTMGGAHDDGQVAILVRRYVMFPDNLLLAATMYAAWHGGKYGFQFLPDPASVSLEEYEEEVENLLATFEALNGDPRAILVNTAFDRDLDFFESLPDRLTIYRGCSGISVEQAAAGVCWSTRRDIAEWFATRAAEINKEEPVLVSARAPKSEIIFARATEYEIVVRPTRFRHLKCRRQAKPGDMAWGALSEDEISAITIAKARLTAG